MHLTLICYKTFFKMITKAANHVNQRAKLSYPQKSNQKLFFLGITDHQTAAITTCNMAA